MQSQKCPCQSSQKDAQNYQNCCGRYHKTKAAPTAETLMRSRYTAYAMGNSQYLYDTWHPTTRPTLQSLTELGAQNLIGLQIISTKAGGTNDKKGMVEFIVHRYSPSLMGEIEQHQEKSLFTRIEGKWVYIDAV